MKKKLLLILLILSLVAIVGLCFYFFIYPNLNPTKRDTKVVSNKLFIIPGGVYYGDGFIASQSTTQDNKNTIFNLMINDVPFNTNSQKALLWLSEQAGSLETLNYTCGPSQYSQATKAEIDACTHIIK